MAGAALDALVFFGEPEARILVVVEDELFPILWRMALFALLAELSVVRAVLFMAAVAGFFNPPVPALAVALFAFNFSRRVLAFERKACVAVVVEAPLDLEVLCFRVVTGAALQGFALSPRS